MSRDFGHIEKMEVVEDEIRLTGHRYVALALGFDDPYQITRFAGVSQEDLLLEKLKPLSYANDVYDCEITDGGDHLIVRFLVWDVEVNFCCKQIIEEYRYYTREEIAKIFEWLPSKCTESQLRAYVSAVQAHGYFVDIRNGCAIVSARDISAGSMQK